MDITNISSSVAAGPKGRTHVRTRIRGQGDPGYVLASGTCPHIHVNLHPTKAKNANERIQS